MVQAFNARGRRCSNRWARNLSARTNAAKSHGDRRDFTPCVRGTKSDGETKALRRAYTQTTQ